VIEATADRLVLATGYFDRTNRLGVPGEDLPHVTHYADEAHLSFGRDVVVIGGKNSAVEMALALWRAGARVTLVYRGAAFKPSVKYWLRPDIENRIRNGEIAARLGAEVVSINVSHVLIRNPDGAEERLPADRVYALVGFLPDFDLFSRMGIRLDPVSGRPLLDPETLETNVPGIHMAGSIVAGRAISEVFIENGRWDGEKIFGDPPARRAAMARYEETPRPIGE
jgi:thioredoxin reductase (NADPH)